MTKHAVDFTKVMGSSTYKPPKPLTHGPGGVPIYNKPNPWASFGGGGGTGGGTQTQKPSSPAMQPQPVMSQPTVSQPPVSVSGTSLPRKTAFDTPLFRQQTGTYDERGTPILKDTTLGDVLATGSVMGKVGTGLTGAAKAVKSVGPAQVQGAYGTGEEFWANFAHNRALGDILNAMEKSSGGKVGEFAAGKAPKSFSLLNLNIGKGSLNTKTAAVSSDYWKNVFNELRSPKTVVFMSLAAAGGSVFGASQVQNDVNNGVVNVGIKLEQAYKTGDMNAVRELETIQNDLIKIGESWANWIPLVGYVSGEAKVKLENIKANNVRFNEIKSQAVFNPETDQMELPNNNTYNPQDAIDLENMKQSNWEVNHAQYIADVEKQRELDLQQSERIGANIKAAQDEKRIKDEEYWNRVRDRQNQDIEQRRKDEQQYWDMVAKKREADKPSKLGFGLLR